MRITLSILSFLFLSLALRAGELKVVVKHADRGETVPYATLKLKSADGLVVKEQTRTDADGVGTLQLDGVGA